MSTELGVVDGRFVVGPASEIPPETMKTVYPDGEPPGIVVFNVNGTFYALRNQCPHMGAPLCKGRITGTSEKRLRADGGPDLAWGRDGEIIACPWHQWQFDIATGRTIFRSKSRVRRYEVELEPGVLERLRKGVETVPVTVDDAMVVLLLE